MTTSIPSFPSAFSERVMTVFGPLFFSGSRPEDSEDEKLRKALIMGGSLLILPVALVWGTLYAAYGEWPAAIITFGYAAADLLAILYLRRTGECGPISFVHWFCTLLLPFALTLLLGGLYASSVLILGCLMAPLGALLYYTHDVAMRLFLGFVVLVLLAGILDPFVAGPNNLPEWLIRLLLILNILIVSALAFFQMRAFVHQRDDALSRLRVEQAKSEGLLANILPKPIAEVLKNNPQTIAERYDAVSILFADVVGFTPLFTSMNPAGMVNLLNEIYTYFDSVVEKYGLEKIRTMGDGYMVASGVPVSRPDHAIALADAALEMLAFLDAWDSPMAREFDLRMGISAGPVLAGVIGRTKFSYDVWGDPVNVASRMESQGEAGKIQVSQDACRLLVHDFELERRGEIEIKGKGKMETWFLVKRKAA